MSDIFSRLSPQKLTNEHDLTEFDCGEPDMNDFLRDDALDNQQKLLSTTHVFVEPGSNRVLAYTTLCTDSLKLTQSERTDDGIDAAYAHYGAIKIARLGVDKSIQNCGIGGKIIQHSIGRTLLLHEHTGCRFVTLDALPHLENWYQSKGFKRNASTSHTKQISMRLDLMGILDT